MNKTITFLDFLMEKHSDQYVGLDDLMTDDFNDWLDSQDSLDLIEYAEMWNKLVIKNLNKK